MNYKNRSNTSCVYDAFEQAGLPVNEEMLRGVRADETFALLKKNGYKVFKKGATVTPPSGDGFFVIRVSADEKSAHAEYHIGAEDVLNYPPESICAIAMKVN